MAFYANLPYAQAPGMGLNAFFTFTVVFGMGYTWKEALGMVFICGIISLIITLTNVRKMIIESIPATLRSGETNRQERTCACHRAHLSRQNPFRLLHQVQNSARSLGQPQAKAYRQECNGGVRQSETWRTPRK